MRVYAVLIYSILTLLCITLDAGTRTYMWLPAKLSAKAHLPPRHPSPLIKQLEVYPCTLFDSSVSMANAQDFSVIWNEAVVKYKSETKSDSLPLDSLGTADSAEAILTAIAGNREDFEDSRGKGKRLRGVLKPVVKIVQRMAEAAGEGASLVRARAINDRLRASTASFLTAYVDTDFLCCQSGFCAGKDDICCHWDTAQGISPYATFCRELTEPSTINRLS